MTDTSAPNSPNAMADILVERVRQEVYDGHDEARDDKRDAGEWCDLLEHYVRKTAEASMVNDYEFRRRLVQVGAVAVAAIERLDRHRSARGLGAPTKDEPDSVEPPEPADGGDGLSNGEALTVTFSGRAASEAWIAIPAGEPVGVRAYPVDVVEVATADGETVRIPLPDARA